MYKQGPPFLEFTCILILENIKKSFLYFQNANVGPVYEIDWVNWSQ